MSIAQDVIVVGAGPAGATTAIALARQGYQVLLLDRTAFPRDKTCGDAIPAGAIHLLQQLGMTTRISQAVERGQFYRIDHLRLVSPGGYVLDNDLRGDANSASSFVAPRLHFDAAIQQHAIDQGVEFCQANVLGPVMDGTRVIGVQANIAGRTVEKQARLVVGADGVTSVLARRLRRNQHNPKHRAVALRAYIDGIHTEPHQIEIFLSKQILPGYGWIFPISDNRANIGVGMRLDKFRQSGLTLPDLLAIMVEMPGIRARLEKGWSLQGSKTWQLSFGSQKGIRSVFDGAILVGDAAGLINPLTGGGIENALISATLAAEIVGQALLAGDTSEAFLRRYEKACHARLWRGMLYSYLLQKYLLDPRASSLLDLLIRRVTVSNPIVEMFMEKL